ncbi:hypothetical protein DGo_PB0362 (plasmid) [Deinococcus gobiensis I-0]|uniref:Uncharacterized protein n=1 Tax=Deinococcus gobiensis (strain DSM 21396 / JCM 16679 / CGMCC 1.7299 / I-0) TaxID=745776 RepID=H8H284_DEIGI|nr:hypothetical protein DGo_PB0362 [Deinococcus gobiensis I-0]
MRDRLWRWALAGWLMLGAWGQAEGNHSGGGWSTSTPPVVTVPKE